MNMKFGRAGAALALVFMFLCSLTACAGGKEISGTYSATVYASTIRYTFEKDMVTVQVFLGGFQVSRYEGTYTINDEENQITLSFDTEHTEDAALSPGLTSLGGTFTFERGERYIVIGAVRYDRADTAEISSPPRKTAPETAQEESIRPPPEDAAPPLSELCLTLPEEFEIQYEVTETSGLAGTCVQTMVKTADGFYFNFGDTGERYLFVRREDGGYTQYLYDMVQGRFSPSAAAVGTGVVDGCAARMTTWFNFYETCRSSLVYQGREKVGEWDCQRYIAEIHAFDGIQTVELWIEPETGLCVKIVCQYDASIGVTGKKTVECIRFSAEDVELPSNG